VRSLWLILLTACSFRAGAPLASQQDDGGPASGDASAGDAAMHDASAIDAMHMPDASTTGPDAGTAGPVVVACYAQGSPSATCTAPDHCCFSNFDSYHDGSCATSACGWGTITCDGPEDCGGQYCCAHAIRDPDLGTIGYTVACQATSCGAAPINQELCHTSGTCSHGTCASALGIDNDLPRALQICQ
jgi:hypothetical protein